MLSLWALTLFSLSLKINSFTYLLLHLRFLFRLMDMVNAAKRVREINAQKQYENREITKGGEHDVRNKFVDAFILHASRHFFARLACPIFNEAESVDFSTLCLS